MDGWFEVRQSGNHKQFKHNTKSGLVEIYVHSLIKRFTIGFGKKYFKTSSDY